jgi:hypothetical protein
MYASMEKSSKCDPPSPLRTLRRLGGGRNAESRVGNESVYWAVDERRMRKIALLFIPSHSILTGRKRMSRSRTEKKEKKRTFQQIYSH